MRIIPIILAAVLAAVPALAQPKWAQGQSYSGNIDIGGVQVPLPPGEWVVTGFQTLATKSDAGQTQTVALVQFNETTVRAYMVFSFNMRALSNGWTVPDANNCNRQEIHHAKNLRTAQTDKSCQYVNHFVFNIASNSAQWWKDFVDYTVKKNIQMPLVSVGSGLVVSDRANYVSALYYFNPAVKDFPAPQNTAWQTSDWNVVNVSTDEKKKAFVQSVIDWTEKSRPMVEAGLAGKLKKGEGLDWPVAMQ